MGLGKGGAKDVCRALFRAERQLGQPGCMKGGGWELGRPGAGTVYVMGAEADAGGAGLGLAERLVAQC